MIVPCPELPRKWSHYPVTLSLAAINIFIYVLFFAGQSPLSAASNLTDHDLRTAGRLFMSESRRGERPSWIEDRKALAPDRLETYGNLALRDRRFLKSLEDGEFAAVADPIAVKKLAESARKFHGDLAERNLHRFGLSSEREAGLAWVTYQFSHAGILHLFSNLVFLLLLGFALETILGSEMLGLLYLIGGLAGGYAYLLMDPNGVVPMVGASGSVSAFIAAYPLLERRRRIRYYYFILPLRGQHGFIHLPTHLIFPLFLVADVAAVLSSPPGLLGGVAYSAHVGGAVAGVVLAGVMLVLKRRRVPSRSTDASQSESA